MTAATGPTGTLLAYPPDVGFRHSFLWQTDVHKTMDGGEHRVAILRYPIESFAGDCILYSSTTADHDIPARYVRGRLFNAAAAIWMLPVWHEGLAVTADVTSTAVGVASIARSDWAVAGQRVVLVSPAGAQHVSHISSLAGLTVITLGAAVSGTFPAGSTLYPLIPVRLADGQQMGRYQVNAGRWSIAGRSISLPTSLGTGAVALTTHAATPVLSKMPPVIGDVLGEAIQAGINVVDFGGAVSTNTSWIRPDIERAARFQFTTDVDRQWWKLFLHHCRGRQRSFLAPTWRSDFVLNAQPTAGASSITINAGSYVEDWASRTYLQLLLADGTVEYVTVTSAVNNGDGTQTLTLVSALTLAGGAVTRVSLLERCRLASDTVTWTVLKTHVEFDLPVVAVQSTSSEANQPIDLYTFVVGATTYRYTSYPADYTHAAQLYLAWPQQRSPLEIAGQARPPDLSIELDAASDLALAVTAGGLPPQTFTVSVSRLEEVTGVATVFYAGDIVAYSISGRVLRMKVVALVDEPLASEVPGVYCQGLCNHVFTDTRCTIVRASHLVTTTISAIDATNNRIVTVASMSGNPTGWANGGELRNVTTDDRRSIHSQVGNVLTLDAPFRVTAALATGNSVEVLRGCDHTATTCRDTYANIVNFGGHPLIPAGYLSNPFSVGIKGTGQF